MIVLVILKWIGIVLLSIVGLLLFLLCLVLFAPVRYTAALEKEEDFRYGFLAGWLFPLFYIRKPIKKERIFFYILGIPVAPLSGKEDTSSEDFLDAGEGKSEQEKEEKSAAKERKREKRESAGRTEKEKGKKKSFSFESVSSIIEFIRDKETQSVYQKLKREVGMLLRYLLPTKVTGQLQIGTGDPASTGLMIGGISLIPLAYQKGIHIVPDFEEKNVRGSCKIRGRIRVIYFVRLAIRLYRDREIRRVWDRMKKKEAV